MWHLILFLLITAKTFNCADQLTIKTNDTHNSEVFDLPSNVTDAQKNQTLNIERIIKPSQPILDSYSTNTNISLVRSNNSEFRPSPPLETYYEYNKFPVVPALPEAKHRSNMNIGEFSWSGNNFPATTESPWSSRVKFPETTVQTIKDHPYAFDNPRDFNTYNSKSKTEASLYKVPARMPSWDKFLDYNMNEEKKGAPKTHFDFSAPVYYEKPHYMESPNPWKKIVKLLTTFLPIGLLISALTPTVITVTPVNATQVRSRAEDALNQGKLFSSLNYFSTLNPMGCEDRILCELLVSASESDNAEEHVKNLLDMLEKNGKAIQRPEDIKRVFEAVKRRDCRPIICKHMKENT